MAEKKSRKGVGGRPPITTNDLPDNWEDLMLNLARQGASLTEIAAKLGIVRQRIYSLRDRDDQFRDIFAQARALAQAWWEEQGRTNLTNRDFNQALWSMNMKGRFREEWGDKQEITQDIKVTGEPKITFNATSKKESD